MFFFVSKVFWLAAAPANVLIGLLAVGFGLLSCGRPGAGRRLLGAAILSLLVCGFLPLGSILLGLLENRFSTASALPDSPAGIIVLGGGINPMISATRHTISTPEAGQRVGEAVLLARRFPKARLIYSGGSGSLTPQIGHEGEVARQWWIEHGIEPGRITLEDRSRNTFENAQFSRAVLAPRPDQRFILVTSAFHMPRAMGLFRAAGFTVVPDPVDYHTTGTWRDWMPEGDAADGLDRFDLATREWTGLVAYRLSGKIAEVFPGP